MFARSIGSNTLVSERWTGHVPGGNLGKKGGVVADLVDCRSGKVNRREGQGSLGDGDSNMVCIFV